MELKTPPKEAGVTTSEFQVFPLHNGLALSPPLKLGRA